MSRTDRDRLEQVLADAGVAFVFDLRGSTGVHADRCDDYMSAAVRAGTDRWVGAHVGSVEDGGAYWDHSGVLRFLFCNPVVEVLWSFNHRQPDLAKLLVEQLTGQGFDASWDGDIGHCVELRLGGAR